MSGEEFDLVVLKAYRAAADERPALDIDTRVLRAAQRYALRRRCVRCMAPLSVAAALALIVGSVQRMREISIPGAQATNAADRVTADLLRLQTPSEAHSAVADFLLDSRFGAGAVTNDVP